jgi:hypothetical protein
MRVTTTGASILGKLWADGATEPAWQVEGTSAINRTGRVVGFYTYLVVGAVLERYEVTFP